MSQAQLQRFFSQRHNFDLRRILEGASSMLDHLVVNLQTDFSLVASSLEVLRLDPKLREEIGDVLTPKSKPSVSCRPPS